ncbi:intermembrane phospholipid transport protein YdbH family protein [Phenylobacterium montanum]|uniref:YdbH domain-containing protein n=1 Tax=Phenylobacterium montanum TaxID=2823693 RepID=A0A975G0W1_9CAUL|nr:YdbH domain-containing protein [Caulobacter sp. S6]QUD89060.1 YdbH domain-containing protein [Caulobacter sp. S6]
MAVVFVAAGAVYLARGRIAEGLARDWLRQQGVVSGLSIRSLSLTGLSASLRVGPAADPDLTVDRVEVGYALTGPWSGAPLGVRTTSLRLVRPRLRLRWSGGEMRYGALQPLIAQLSKPRPGGGPAPDVTIEQAVLVLVTPDGQDVFRGGGALKKGLLTDLSGSLDPYRAGLAGVRLQGEGGAFELHRTGERMSLTIDLGPVNALAGAARLHAARVKLGGELPFPAKGGAWRGPVRLALTGLGVTADSGDLHASGGVVNLDLDGAGEASPARQVLTGRMLLTGQVAQAQRPGARLNRSLVQIDLTQLAVVRDASGLSLTGEGAGGLSGGVDTAGAQAQVQTGAIRIRGLKLLAQGGRFSRAGTLEGGLAGHAAFAAARAHSLAQRVPVLSDEKPYAAAIERALHGFRFAESRWRAELSDHGVRLALGAPLTVDAGSGARLTLAAAPTTIGAKGIVSAGRIELGGGGLPTMRASLSHAAITSSGFSADLAAESELDALFARGAQVQAKGRLSGHGGQVRFDLDGCAPQRAHRLDFGPNSVDDFAASLCPGDGPLLVASAEGWRARGQLQQAQGAAPSFEARVTGADGAFQAIGRHALEAAEVSVDKAQLADTAKPLRFRDLNLAGRANLAGGVWTGDFAATTHAGHRIGKVDLRQVVASGTGRADIDTGPLAFAPNALQPAELTPQADFARNAQGVATFKGWFAWGPGAPAQSGGELKANGLEFKSPLGAVLGINSDLHFTSLSPLVTQPGQKVNVELVQAATPLSGLSAQFDLDARSVSIDQASGAIAEGRIRLEPMVAPLAAGAPFKGVLVIDHVRIGQVLAASSLADSVKLDAVVDGRIPFTVSSAGLTIQGGELRAVGPGRLSISRKALKDGASAKQAGFAEDLAYQAMGDLAFDTLDASLNTLPGDRLGVLFHIKGRHAPPKPQRATIALSDLLRGQPLAKPLTLPSDTRIDLTLDTSLNFGELVRALQQAWRDSLGQAQEPGGSASVQAEHGPLAVKQEVKP